MMVFENSLIQVSWGDTSGEILISAVMSLFLPKGGKYMLINLLIFAVITIYYSMNKGY